MFGSCAWSWRLAGHAHAEIFPTPVFNFELMNSLSHLSVKPRRRPTQSRAWMTSIAIQDAFLTLLMEKEYGRVSMRDISNVAGVSIGSLYQYFPSKDSIAAMTVRTWTRKLHTALAAATESTAQPQPAQTLGQIARRLVDAQVRTMTQETDRWRATCALARRITPQGMHGQFFLDNVELFRTALARAVDWPADVDGSRLAFNAYTIVDALVIETLLVQAKCPSAEQLAADTADALEGYLHTALKPRQVCAISERVPPQVDGGMTVPP